jgi:acyl-coenzyme A thioesterase PaaI-like protein
MKAFQDQIANNHCYGCGPDNAGGLRIKSYWSGDNASVCRFMPAPHHSAGPPHYLNGGVIATIIDCHCICTAIAKGYQLAGREAGQGEPVWFATGRLEVDYKRPVRIDREVTLQAEIVEVAERKTILRCLLLSDNEVCVEARVIAVRVPNEW